MHVVLLPRSNKTTLVAAITMNNEWAPESTRFFAMYRNLDANNHNTQTHIHTDSRCPLDDLMFVRDKRRFNRSTCGFMDGYRRVRCRINNGWMDVGGGGKVVAPPTVILKDESTNREIASDRFEVFLANDDCEC